MNWFINKNFTTHPLDEVDDLIHSGVAGDPLVNVGDNVHTDVTQEVLGLLDLAGLGRGDDQEGEGDRVHGDAGTELRELGWADTGQEELLYTELSYQRPSEYDIGQGLDVKVNLGRGVSIPDDANVW